MAQAQRDAESHTTSDRSVRGDGIGALVSPRVAVFCFGVLFLVTGLDQFSSAGWSGGGVQFVATTVTLLQLAVGVGLLFMLRWAYYGAVLVLAVHLLVYFLRVEFLPLSITIGLIGIFMSYSRADWKASPAE